MPAIHIQINVLCIYIMHTSLCSQHKNVYVRTYLYVGVRSRLDTKRRMGTLSPLIGAPSINSCLVTFSDSLYVWVAKFTASLRITVSSMNLILIRTRRKLILPNITSWLYVSYEMADKSISSSSSSSSTRCHCSNDRKKG